MVKSIYHYVHVSSITRIRSMRGTGGNPDDLVSSSKCNTLIEVGCCDEEELRASERGGPSGTYVLSRTLSKYPNEPFVFSIT